MILITIDGLRWQEVFSGVQEDILRDKNSVKYLAKLEKRYLKGNALANRAALMPFMWNTIAKQGVLIGDRQQQSNMSVANDLHFSYPGYSDLLTGVVNPDINSNAKVLNNEVSFLEWLNHQPEYGHSVAVFGSWDVFPFIVNKPRSQLHVNAGFDSAHSYELSEQMLLLNQLQTEIPSPWQTVRLDSFTYRFAKDYLTTVKPRVMMIAFGETDDFAHDGNYQAYLEAATRTDQFINDLWLTLQSMQQYKDNTNILIVTDHGRGSNLIDWQHHASKSSLQGYMKGLAQFENGIEGSEHIWMAALGPDIKASGILKTNKELKQTQIPATALTLLNENKNNFNQNAAAAITEILK